MKTIALPEDLHKELMKIKLNNSDKSISEILRKMLCAYKEQQFLENSRRFREMIKKSGKSFDQFLKEARKVKEEVVNEQFPNL